MPVGREVTNEKTGERAWWDGKKLTPLNAQGFQVKVPAAAPGMDPEAFRRARDSVQAIDNAKDRTNWARTGLVGGLTSRIAGTPAYNLDKDLDTLKARTAFDELAAMRRSSPTGGALGAISEGEMKLLQASEANLDVGQGERQLDSNLNRMRSTIVSRNPGLALDSPVDLSDGRSREPLPRGAYYRDPQGNVRRNDNGDKGNPIFKASTPASGTGASKPRPPQRGQVVDGYRYTGGNPADPKSWAKQ